MLAELTQAVSRVEQNQLLIGQSVQSLDERVRVFAEQQATLIALLTPTEKPKKGGPGLDELLAEMIVRLDQQNYLLKDVSDTVSRAVTTLPLSIVKAMADAFPPADEPAAATPRNGHRGGAA
jgi:hypothetical protein